MPAHGRQQERRPYAADTGSCPIAATYRATPTVAPKNSPFHVLHPHRCARSLCYNEPLTLAYAQEVDPNPLCV